MYKEKLKKINSPLTNKSTDFYRKRKHLKN